MNYVRGEFVMKSVNFKNNHIVFLQLFNINLFSHFLTKKKLYNAELLLNEVKTYFREVKGSYIVQEPIVLENINQNQPIYQGGITVLKMTILLIMSFMQMLCQDKLLTLLNSESKLILYNNKTLSQ